MCLLCLSFLQTAELQTLFCLFALYALQLRLIGASRSRLKVLPDPLLARDGGTGVLILSHINVPVASLNGIVPPLGLVFRHAHESSNSVDAVLYKYISESMNEKYPRDKRAQREIS